MARILHGQTLEQANAGFADLSACDHAFAFLFPDLQQHPENLLPENPDTPASLKKLGIAMEETAEAGFINARRLPAIFTYLGQFIDHDLTLETTSAKLPALFDPAMRPLKAGSVELMLCNLRTPFLDLDSVYGETAGVSGPRQLEKMLVGRVSSMPPGSKRKRPVSKEGDDHHDLPRRARTLEKETDREALIGDPRNDENLIVAQLHVAFLRAHNAIVDKGFTFEDARALLIQHYQYIILNEYLPAIADKAIVQSVRLSGNRFFALNPSAPYMPLEFSTSAFRFGHSMVRANYDFNSNFGPKGAVAESSLALLFTFTALSGQLGDEDESFDTLPETWIIEWERFVGSSNLNLARRIDTDMGEPLFKLPDVDGNPMKPPEHGRLAVRNLLRGYLLRQPTGQAVARSIGVPLMTRGDFARAGVIPEQRAILQTSGFDERTPLWYYILAEAALEGGERLGPVGSTIVAETLIGLIRLSPHSILGDSNWAPTLGKRPGEFTLADLLELAGVLTRRNQ